MDPQAYSLIKSSVKTLLDINLDHYKAEQMWRRLDSWLARSGSPTWPDYFKRVRADTNERSRFRNYLTINVSSFFRDSERWRDMRERVLPELFQASPRLRLWSAGCSTGAEPYTLAILLDELAPNRAYSLLATDLDRGALAAAQARGPYSADDMRQLTAAQRAKYLEPGGPPFRVSEKLGRRITFREQNLLADPFEPGFDLIVCRNVVIYFTNDAKDALYRKFLNALKPGGVLFVGGTEIIPRAQDLGFRTHGISFYQKVGNPPGGARP